VDDFARYNYLPRLQDPSVLYRSIQDGVSLLTWAEESFACADSYDEAEGRYRGLRGGTLVSTIEGSPSSLVVRGDVAAGILSSRRLASLSIEPASVRVAPGGKVSFGLLGGDQDGQPVKLSGVTWQGEGGTIDREGNFEVGGKEGVFQVVATVSSFTASATVEVSAEAPPTPVVPPVAQVGPRRFHGSVRLDPSRAGRDAGQIAEEVLAHLQGIMGANVEVTLEIEARIPSGAPENIVRTVTENCRTLKFTIHGFEKE
jgi:hypothetical protein